jgi:hypothetical protein
MTPCDANANGFVEANDLAIMQRSRGATAGPNDPRDVDHSGTITSTDIAACQQVLQPQLVPIPTLSEWGLGILWVLLALLAIHYLIHHK